MGKRSEFPRIERDCYDTPPEAVAPLIAHLPSRLNFWEPCAGAWSIVEALYQEDDKDTGPAINCTWASDVAPRHSWVDKADAFAEKCPEGVDYIITNPPWTRPILHRMIEHFSDMRPTWLLFDADWMHTKQAAPYLWRLQKIVSVGRVKWIKDSPHTGKDNCCWYLFDAKNTQPPKFFGRRNDA